MPLRITTWNVNGIRNPFGYQPWRDRRTFDGMFSILEADIVIMQELKIQRKDLRDDMVLVPGWDCYFSLPKHKKGYSGVAIYTRQDVCAPIRAEEGVLGVLCPPGSTTAYCDLPEEEHIGGYLSPSQLADCGVDAAFLDSEGRCVVLEFPAFVIFGIYSPANSSGTRDDFRYGFLNALDMRIRNLINMGKRVVVTGDLNVSREEIDTAGADDNMRKEGITHEQYISTPNRRIFNQLLEGGQVVGQRDEGREQPVMWDICRGFHPTRKGMFTHWEQKINARPGNFGSRIDFILCSLDMKQWFCESDIQEGLHGSDHCPVYAVLKNEVDCKSALTPLKDIMSPAGFFKGGLRQQPYSVKDVPAFSGKLLQEFNNRRSIKDMFSKKPTLQPSTAANASQDASPQMESVTQTSTVQENEKTPSTSQVDSVATNSPIRSTCKASDASPPSPASSAPKRSPERKRPAPITSNGRSSKRSKSGASTIAPNPNGKGQQSLTGFFKPKDTPAKIDKDGEADADPDDETVEDRATVNPGSTPTTPLKQAAKFRDVSAGQSISSPDPPPPPDGDEDALSSAIEVHDPIVAKESWSKVFSKPKAPLCECHEEPCKIMKTKKPGFNCGREFYMCARPLGPSGTKERNTQWRCPTFIWTSDWNSGGTGS